MKKRIYGYLWLLTSVAFFAEGCEKTPEVIEPPKEPVFYIPSNFPPPEYDLSKNPVTKEGFALGKSLFYDGLLSKDGTISCGFCHQQFAGFTHHGHDLSHGFNDLLTMRNAMPIQNLAWEKEFMWDGGVFDLDLFAPAPIENPHEMAETMPNVLNKIRNSSKYPPMFKEAFGSEEVTTDRFLKALSQFQLLCISADSKYDRYVRNEGAVFTAEEAEGRVLFTQKCASCHKGELFSDLSYRNNGISRKNILDYGRERITLDSNDRYKFKVPSLRNVEKTGPYMHSGRYQSLESVLNHYATGVEDSPTLDPLLKQNGQLGIPMTETEKQKIIAFLYTLTDQTFLNNKMLSEY